MTFSLNTLKNDPNQPPQDEDGVSGLRRFAQEIALTVGFVLLVVWFLALATHNSCDSAWSTTGGMADCPSGVATHNLAGKLGALISDFCFMLMGYSVWWAWFAGVGSWLAALAQRLRESEEESSEQMIPWRRTKAAFWIGLVMLLVCSSAIEWLHLYRFDDSLPGHKTGGILGYIVGGSSQKWIGSTGAALCFIVFGLVSASWVFRFSWSSAAERLGDHIDGMIQTWRERRERAQDEAYGLVAAREREEGVLEERTDIKEHHHEPIYIEPTPYIEPGSVNRKQNLAEQEELKTPVPVVAVPSSSRVAKERQQHLFAEIKDSNLPQVDLLDPVGGVQDTVSVDTLEMTSRLIEKKLKDFGVEVRVVAASPGPVITRYEIEPATGVKGSQVLNLAKDLARSLSLVSIRVVETIPGKNYMALELPNAKRQTIRLSEILGSSVYNEAKSLLTMGLGKDIVGNSVVADLAKMPHVLVAGTTGSGKSVGINAMILSLLYKAEASDVRLLMIDPKMLEMSVYEGIPHLLAPVVTDMRQAAHGLNWCVAEMEKRYRLMSKLGVRNLAGYNAKIDEASAREEFIYNPFSLTPETPEPLERLPHIVVVIDELADLMMVVGKKIEELIARLAQKARAAGIHLILATQRPSVDVITGLIKANIPTRIAFQVSSKIDSRTILDQMGAETLLGMGDMLYLPSGTGFPIRVHGAFVSDEEVHRVVSYLKSQGEPNYIEGVLEGGVADGEGNGGLGGIDLFGEASSEKDPLYDQAVEIVLKNRKASISLVQRYLKIGYNRAARLVEDMEKAGLVSAMGTNGQREILVPRRDE
jgi:DNA segregation ATPase FtsK/SpoIIIE, S-DNA-T family